MKLKARVASLDDVPEQYRNQYTQSEDGKSWTLDEIELEDVSGLKANNERLLTQHKTSQAELKKLKESLGDLDPEKAREAIKRLEELENKQLMDEGKIEELYEKRFKSERSTLQAKIDALANEVKTREDNIAKLTQDLAKTSRTGQLGKALIEAKVDPKWFEYVEMKAEKIWQWQEDQLVPIDGDGPLFVDGKTPDMTTWITNVVAKARPEIMLPNSGGGANGNSGYRNGGVSISRADARDTQKYEAAKSRATQAGVELQITE